MNSEPKGKGKIKTGEDSKSKATVSTAASTSIHDTPTPPILKMTEIPGSFRIETYDSTKHKWSTWLQRLEGAFAAFEITTETKKRTYLLQYIGIDTYMKLDNAMDGINPYLTALDTIKEKLKSILEPEPLEAAEIFVFHQRKQLEDESIRDFVNDLHKLSAKCNFGTYLKTALRTQLIAGLRNPNIQARLLETQNLTFDTAVTTAITMEIAESSTRQLRNTNTNAESIQYINSDENRHKIGTHRKNYQKRNPDSAKLLPKNSKTNAKSSNSYVHGQNSRKIAKSRNINCYRCGKEHYASECTINKNVECNFCKKKGHLSRVCFAKKKESANTVEEICTIDSAAAREKFVLQVLVERYPVDFEVDTGAAVSLMSAEQAKSLFPKHKVYNSNIKLQSFNKDPIDTVGYIKVQVEFKTRKISLNLYIVRIQCKPLLGREWFRELIHTDNLFKTKEVRINSVHTVNDEQIIQNLLRNYDICNERVEPIKFYTAKFTLKDNAKPIFIKHRSVPFKLQDKIKRELDSLVAKQIFIPVKSSEWATPIVPVLKKDGTVRICGDYSVTLNKKLVIDEYPLPRLEELFSCMAGMTVFSKIDLKHAYLQLQVSEEQQNLLTLSTHCGLYKPTRLMFGTASAPAIWQRTIEGILHDIDGIKAFLDDIRIASPTKKEHIEKLNLVFKRLHDHNIQINLEKCEFFRSSIHFCGYIIDKNGINKDPSKYAAIKDMPHPKNKSEVRAFLGFVNYYARFIRNLSTILHPIYNLLKDKVPFNWNKQCENAFIQAKQAFCENKILAHYDPKLPLILAVDASSYGVGAVLSHIYPNGSERIIQCASQKLNNVQQKYANIDKEAYAIIFGIKKFHQYLFGTKFTLITDNQALTRIFSPDKNLPTFAALRMQHYALFLRAYNYEIRYKNSEKNANADGLSRLPLDNENNNYDVAHIFHVETIESLPITANEIAELTRTDAELQQIYEAITNKRTRSKEQKFNLEEFSICNDVILRNDRVIVPVKLRKRMLTELHWGHFGIVKMKNLARTIVWWPSMNKDIENLVKNCTICNLHRNNPAKITEERLHRENSRISCVK
ncbi:uncharacterized protein K02A2.6-like [Ceratina calcarata]|uniref:RNA-directed DNA polymerase n=1 Tax=Ceratina calcarata TaxID=156304 RepID=A0AAJ7JES1_9HYME|nr:uncharacterized protein K02A2.6-like [Ceratina calcarata]